MKIVTINLQKEYEKTAFKESLNYSLFNDVDLIILTGYLEGIGFRYYIEEAGFNYLALSSTNLSQDRILIASRTMLAPFSSYPVTLQESGWLEVHLPEHELKILGIFIPETTDIQSKKVFLQRFIQYAEENVAAKVIIVGHFSTPADALGTILNFKSYFQKVSSLGWIDAWRYLHPITYEQIWFSNAKKGLQLDFVILSPPLEEHLLGAYHSQIPSNIKHAKPKSRALIVELE